MKEKITQFARGNFSNAKANIKLSVEAVAIKTEEGRSYKSSFLISNDAGIPMKGILYSECSYLKLSHKQFEGTSVLIEYELVPEILTAGEKISDVIHIISSCGEISVPFSAEIMTPTVRVPAVGDSVVKGYSYNEGVRDTKSGRKISDLNEFAELAKDNSKAAIEVFCREDFVPVFLHGDIKKEILYNTLIKGPSPVQAMEEFLININKKNRVVISVDRHHITYTDCERNIYDGITIRKNTWGYQAVRVTSDSPYIVPEHKTVYTDRWDENETVLKFWIDKSALKEGINTGTICLDTINRHIEIVINCEVRRDKKHSVVKPERLWARFLREYVDYLVKKTDKYAFFAGVDDIVVECRRYELENLLQIIGLFKGLALGENTVNDGDFGVLKEYDEACMLHFLMNTEYKNENAGFRFKKLCGLLEEGSTSPLLYYEYCRFVRENPEYIHEWSDFSVRPLAWGIRHNMIDAETAIAYTYHVSRMRQHNKIILGSLKQLYDTFGNIDTLEAICSMLIRNVVISKDAAVWYERGIKNQLRITRIYEYYMLSLPDEGWETLPPQVVMYFAYDNNLADREKAILYAFIIKDKENNPTAYSTYQERIREFATEQLEHGCINKHLAVIYADSVKKQDIDGELAGLFARVMFINEISCVNPQMKEVCVVTDELENEYITPVKNGRAYINICADSQTIFLIDGHGNRYLSDDYTIKGLIRYDGYPEKCFEYNKTDELLLTHMYAKCLKEYQLDEDIIEIRRAAVNGLNLRDYYEKKNISALIGYYYNHADGEGLDAILADVDLTNADGKNRNKWIEMFIVRGMYDKAMEAVESYGFYGLNLDRLSKFCDDMIGDIGVETQNDTLVMASYHIFNKGRYSDNIIKYLVAYYIGPFENMYKIFKTADGFEINTCAISERLLILSVFTERVFEDYSKVLASYLGGEWDKEIVRAFACYMSYRYLTDNQEIEDLLWYWIRDNMIPMQNTCCVLAMLKRLSKEENIDVKSHEFIIKWLPNMVEKGIIMEFFTSFTGKVPVPAGVSGMAIMEHIDRPKKNIKIGFCINNNVPILGDAKEVFYGIYVKELALFAGEKIVYEFYEEQGEDKKVINRGSVCYEENMSADVTRVRMINDMIKCRQENDTDELYDRMESYIRQKQASKHLFKML